MLLVITERTIMVLRAVIALTASAGIPPTVREVGDHVGLTGPSVHRHIAMLHSEGLVDRRPSTPRGLVVTDSGRLLAAAG